MAGESAGAPGGVAALGAGLVLADQLPLWLERRGWIYWRRRKGLSPIGSEFPDAGSRFRRGVGLMSQLLPFLILAALTVVGRHPRNPGAVEPVRGT
ncbi:hypothetical protein [Streptomyces sp. TRM68367]|uniref:hypothetical protein n=1 Tax=Streptomyces sp. TRM68367 TaxID=2758415 RepID=UPI00165A7FF2|nr:hypothetical protein [Streptomyces sp. TRM68367]MBC9727634.1 hypothetical protein [Streptomyces sp. TRM68367]